jgi:HTH-type transcriptional regulator, competence development regulator
VRVPDDHDDAPVTFGQLLRDLRRTGRLTQRDVAAKVGIDFTYLSKLENDRDAPPGEDTIRRLAAVLGSDPERLLAAAGKVPPELKQRATRDPRFAMLLRRLADLPKDQLDDVYKEAGMPPEAE